MFSPKDCVTKSLFNDLIGLVLPFFVIMAVMFGAGLVAGWLIWGC